MLNISGLKLTELKLLQTLPHLKKLIAADNNFESSDYIASSINHLSYLKVAVFADCPAQKNDIHYRDRIILESKSLGNSIFIAKKLFIESEFYRFKHSQKCLIIKWLMK